ncbi:MAG: glutamate-1-semialdehyde-2,1-aminomutase [Chitinophagaceae bacterium]|nr:MAG: glutamate-1-semialdehyde-2,1-aminomutase [Chitinophagaceae bacterium]
MTNDKSIQLFEQAQKVIPGGVNSPVRAFKGVGGSPLFMNAAKGAYLFDEDGNKYIDYINSWGPMICGHSYEPVTEALRDQVTKALSFGAPTVLETEMATLINKMVPGIDMVRMVNSGTEACMSALRLARAVTGRNKLIKFEGCYHGHADSFLVSAGSGLATFNIQSVPGVTSAVAQDTLACPYNDIDAVRQLVEQHPDQVAAIIIEPVAGNMGCVPPAPGFLEALREICNVNGILLIFDEVMTGFRLAPGGAQEVYNINADILTFGKIIGGGLPVGAYAARAEIMQQVAPSGKVYQAGTLSGNPLAMRAGFALLSALDQDPGIYERINERTRYLHDGLATVFSGKGIPVAINRVGSMISVHFTDKPVVDFNSSAAADSKMFSQYFHHNLAMGVYLPPSAFETWFISDALTQDDLDSTLEAAQSFSPTK